MRRRMTPVLGLVVLFFAAQSFAQAPEGPPKPGPEHQKLGYYAGKWSGKGELKPGAFGPDSPGGPMTWSETCEWFPGNFSIVCKSEGNGPMGKTEGLGILGYNTEKKVYTYTGVDSMGWAGHADGNAQGDTWTYTSEETMGGKTMKGRYTIKQVSPTSQTFKYETSADGQTWSIAMEGGSTKSM